uniref:Uncharacterized protein n=1 Tax=Oryza rufipogon TaxID=4529 RepID=A0A0E0QQP7_ORYRU
MATNSATATRKMAVVICMLALILGHQQLMAVDASPAPEQHGLRLLGDCAPNLMPGPAALLRVADGRAMVA